MLDDKTGVVLMDKILNIGHSHETIKEIKKIKIKSNEFVYLEDISVMELLAEEERHLEIFIYCPELCYSPLANKIIDFYSKHSKEVYTVSQKTYQDIAEKDNSAGLIGIYKMITLDIDKIDPEDYQYIVVCDSLENPGNLGTILRSCDAGKVDLLITVDSKTSVFNPKVLASSRGMLLFLPVVIGSYASIQAFLEKNFYSVYLGEPELGKSYDQYDYDGKVAIVIGNERFGINSDWYNHPNNKVFIPMYGKIGSLNVGVAASILIMQASLKRNEKKHS